MKTWLKVFFQVIPANLGGVFGLNGQVHPQIR